MSKGSNTHGANFPPLSRVMIHRPTGRVVGPAVPVFPEDIPFRNVAPATKVWRYMDFWKLKDWITNAGIRFARGDRFKDNLDGRCSPGNLERQSRSDAAFASAYPLNDGITARQEQNEVTRECVFISCWNIADKESQRMWREYCQTTQSVAIVSSTGRLQRFLPDEVMSSGVTYVPDTFPRSQLTYLTVYYYKSLDFQFENEFRLLRPLKEGETVKRADPMHYGRYVSVNLRKIACEIVVHPDATPAFSAEVAFALNESLPGIQVRKSALPPQGASKNAARLE